MVCGGRRARATANLSGLLVSQSLTLVDDRFERPVDFDLGEHWKASSARYEENLLRSQAVVRVSPPGLDLMFAWTATEAAARMAGPPDASGWREVVLPIESIDRATADMLRFGAEVEVLAPADLRERVADSIRAMSGIYSRSADRLASRAPPRS